MKKRYKIYNSKLGELSEYWSDKINSDPAKYWDIFYQRNEDNFFKDRHYLHKEFPQLLDGQKIIIELGCGTGNTVYPLLKLNPKLKFYAIDYSNRAIQLVKQHPSFTPHSITPIVADPATTPLAESSPTPHPPPPPNPTLPHTDTPLHTHLPLPRGHVSHVMLIFMLSAVHPTDMRVVLRHVADVLPRHTGRVLFRDYEDGDLAMLRLAGAGRAQRIGPRFYMRGDGTRCYYFQKQELVGLFQACGFVCDWIKSEFRIIRNEKQRLDMKRRWIQAQFTHDPDAAAQQLLNPGTTPINDVTVNSTWSRPQINEPGIYTQHGTEYADVEDDVEHSDTSCEQSGQLSVCQQWLRKHQLEDVAQRVVHYTDAQSAKAIKNIRERVTKCYITQHGRQLEHIDLTNEATQQALTRQCALIHFVANHHVLFSHKHVLCFTPHPLPVTTLHLVGVSRAATCVIPRQHAAEGGELLEVNSAHVVWERVHVVVEEAAGKAVGVERVAWEKLAGKADVLIVDGGEGGLEVVDIKGGERFKVCIGRV